MPSYKVGEIVRAAEDVMTKHGPIQKGEKLRIEHIYPSGAHFEVFTKQDAEGTTPDSEFVLVHISQIEKEKS